MRLRTELPRVGSGSDAGAGAGAERRNPRGVGPGWGASGLPGRLEGRGVSACVAALAPRRRSYGHWSTRA